MDFFKQIQKPATHEVVVVEKRPHGNTGVPKSKEMCNKLSKIYKGKSMVERLGKETAQQVVEKQHNTKKANGSIRTHQGKTLREWAEIHNTTLSRLTDWVYVNGMSNVHKYRSRRSQTQWQGIQYSDWAEKLGVTVGRVTYFLKKDGHLDNCAPFKPRAEEEYQGLTVKQWANKLQLNYGTIIKHLDKHGNLDHLPKPKPRFQGKTASEWAKELGLPHNGQIRIHLKKYGNLDKLIAKKG